MSQAPCPLALVSHFLFLFGEDLDYRFHIDSLLDLLRVAAEVRVFPVVDTRGNRSPHLSRVIDDLGSRGFECALITTPYEVQRGASDYLRISRNEGTATGR